ncbi:MAG: hypothetical protein EXR98_13520, partial [Gemmataceae bacterium]|nr:hypothetical protein [Gemmataceae bacterium]
MPRRVDDNDDRDDDDDDEDDRPVRQKAPLTGLDHTFAKTDMVGLVIFGLCCGWVAVILSLVALLTCKDETA